VDWEFVGFLAVVGTVIAAATAVRRRQRVRQRRRVLSGLPERFPVRVVGVGAPYPSHASTGRLLRDRMVVGTDVLRVELARDGGVLDLTRTGLRPLRVRAPLEDEPARDEDVVVACVDGTGTAVSVVVDEGQAELLRFALSSRRLPDDAEPPRWQRTTGRHVGKGTVALLACGAAASALTVAALGTSMRVETPVRGLAPGGACAVEWVDPRDGVAHRSEVDCLEQPGEVTTIHTLAGPLRGAAVDEVTPFAWAALDAALLGAGGWLLWGRGRRRRSPAPSSPAIPVDRPGPELAITGRLDPADLTRQTLSALAQRRARSEGWGEPDRRYQGRRPPRPWLLHLGEIAVAAIGVVPVVAVALGVGWTSYAGVLAALGARSTAEATVTGDPTSSVPFVTADDLPVRFTTRDGRTIDTAVAVHGLPEPPPTTIDVEYSVAAPERVVAVEHAGHVVGVALPTLVLLVLGGFALRLAGGALVQARRRRRARASGAVSSVAYAMFLDPGGVLVMLLFTGGGGGSRAEWILPVHPTARHRLRAAGTATIHGALTAGAMVAVTVDGHPVKTVAPLFAADTEDVLELVNETDLFT
jgi:hypothetical protein